MAADRDREDHGPTASSECLEAVKRAAVAAVVRSGGHPAHPNAHPVVRNHITAHPNAWGLHLLSRSQLDQVFAAMRGAAAQCTAKHVTWLQLSSVPLRTLSSGVSVFTRLTHLSLSSNYLQELPAALSACRALIVLNVSSNQLRGLPPTLGELGLRSGNTRPNSSGCAPPRGTAPPKQTAAEFGRGSGKLDLDPLRGAVRHCREPASGAAPLQLILGGNTELSQRALATCPKDKVEWWQWYFEQRESKRQGSTCVVGYLEPEAQEHVEKATALVLHHLRGWSFPALTVVDDPVWCPCPRPPSPPAAIRGPPSIPVLRRCIAVSISSPHYQCKCPHQSRFVVQYPGQIGFCQLAFGTVLVHL